MEVAQKAESLQRIQWSTIPKTEAHQDTLEFLNNKIQPLPKSSQNCAANEIINQNSHSQKQSSTRNKKAHLWISFGNL